MQLTTNFNIHFHEVSQSCGVNVTIASSVNMYETQGIFNKIQIS